MVFPIGSIYKPFLGRERGGGAEEKIASPNMKLKSSVSKNINEPEGDT